METLLSSFQPCNIKDNENTKYIQKIPFSAKLLSMINLTVLKVDLQLLKLITWNVFAMHWQKHDLSWAKTIPSNISDCRSVKLLHLENFTPCSNPNVRKYMSTLTGVKGYAFQHENKWIEHTGVLYVHVVCINCLCGCDKPVRNCKCM